MCFSPSPWQAHQKVWIILICFDYSTGHLATPTCKGKSSGEVFQTDMANVKSSEEKKEWREREEDLFMRRKDQREGKGMTGIRSQRTCPWLKLWCVRRGTSQTGTKMRIHVNQLCLKDWDWAEGTHAMGILASANRMPVDLGPSGDPLVGLSPSSLSEHHRIIRIKKNRSHPAQTIEKNQIPPKGQM